VVGTPGNGTIWKKPEVVWLTLEQFRNKNRWLRGSLAVVQP
jgi:hypothetical protein